MVALLSLMMLLAGGHFLLAAPDVARALDPLAPPDVTAESVYVFDATLDTTLYEKNADERRSPASLTKVATALVVLEHVSDMSETVIIDPADVLDPNAGESMMGLVAGDVLTVEQLMYGLLINSGNDAAYALARHVGQQLLDAEGGSGDPQARFVQEMNALAAGHGLTNSHFENPEGLYHPDHLTTARELGILTKLALSNELVATIAATEEITINSLSAVPVAYPLVTTNKILGENGVNGVKTGTLSESGACLIASRTGPAGTLVIGVVMGSDIEFSEEGYQDPETDKRYDDMRAILSAMDRDFTWLSPSSDDALPGLAAELDVWDVELVDADPIVLPSAEITELRYVLRLGPPASAQSEVGELLLYDGTELIAERPVVQLDLAA
jgi:D-alanyl-D-alanine carboxypeptidase (penicillin-binding protein 5/6)